MALQDPNHFPAEDVVYLERDSQNSALVHLHGGTLLSWKCKGKENLFLSSTAIFNNKKAIRGGVPLVFPKFGPWSLGPQHGFARIKRWAVEESPKKTANGNVVASLSLKDDEETRAMWNYKFKLVYTLELCENSLRFQLDIHNSGDASFDFTCLLHTYLRIADITSTYVTGLKDLTYDDKVKADHRAVDPREKVIVDQHYDRIYQNAPQTVCMTSGPDPPRTIELTASNFPDIVLWNPWEQNAKSMGDFDDLGYKEMICVEAGKVSSPVTLAAGQNYQCSQILKSML